MNTKQQLKAAYEKTREIDATLATTNLTQNQVRLWNSTIEVLDHLRLAIQAVDRRDQS